MKLYHLTIIITLICSIILFVFSVPAFSQNETDQKKDSEFGFRYKNRMGDRFLQMAEALGLSEDQEILFQNMNKAKTINRQLKRDSARYMRTAFKKEMAKENPDFKSAAKLVKTKYTTRLEQTFDSMIDATVAFYSSLDAEQRQALLNFEKTNKGRGRWRKDRVRDMDNK